MDDYLECYECGKPVPPEQFHLCADCGLGYCEECGVLIPSGEDFTEEMFFCHECE